MSIGKDNLKMWGLIKPQEGVQGYKDRGAQGRVQITYIKKDIKDKRHVGYDLLSVFRCQIKWLIWVLTSSPPQVGCACKSLFTNDLTNFLFFPALGAEIPNFLPGSPLTLKINLHFLILDPDWAIFRCVTSQKSSKMRGLEILVYKALQSKNYFCNFLYTTRNTTWRDEFNKN